MAAVDENAPVRRHVATAREHLAGVKAGQVWVQELAAAHLLRTQQPIRDQPIPNQDATAGVTDGYTTG